MSVVPDDDIERAANRIRPMLALYMGGMGARDANFHYDVFCRMGYQHVADEVQDMYLTGHKQEAAGTIPIELVEEVALIGPMDKIAADLRRWDDTVVTVLQLSGPPTLLAAMAELVAN